MSEAQIPERFQNVYKQAKGLQERGEGWHWADVMVAVLDDFASAEAEVKRLRDALRRLVSLIDQGVLVRDISRDDEPGWGIRMLEMVSVLHEAAELTQQAPAAKGE